MKFNSKIIYDKSGREVLLRSAEVCDANALIRYMNVTAGETDFLIREPGELSMSEKDEQAFILTRINSRRELMLVAFVDGKHIGSCSLMSMGPYRRYAHRCKVAIALYGEYCGMGIGRQMLDVVLSVAKEAGYEQAELNVVSDNHDALALYGKMGFVKYGVLPDNMKYADGRYADAYWMMKKLQ